MKRKMFSITTMASSITMPTERVKASSVRLFSVKPMYWTMAKAAMIEVGIDRAAMTVARTLARKKKTMMAAKAAADQQVMLDGIDRGLDEDRLVADDLHVIALRHRAL